VSRTTFTKMFKTEDSGGVCTESLLKELNELRTMNYLLSRTLEKESLARQRAELDLRLLQMEVEDNSCEPKFRGDSSQAMNDNSVIDSSGSTLSFAKANNSRQSYNFLVDKSAPIAYPHNSSIKNFSDLKRNISLVNDLQKKTNSKRKSMKKLKVQAKMRSKQSFGESELKSLSFNEKKKAMKKQVALNRSKFKKRVCISGKENLPDNDQRKRQYVFCKHCKEVRYLLPVCKREGMPSAFRHLCKTATGKVHVQRTLEYRASTCHDSHLGPCLRPASFDEIGQAGAKVNKEVP